MEPVPTMLPKAAILTVFVTAAFLLSGCSGSGGTATGKSVDMKAPTKFDPQTLTIKVGEMVTWHNRDASAHTVNSDNATTGPLNSGTVAPGGTYSYTFSVAGTYTYHCKPHSVQGTDGKWTGMTATIIVTA